MNLKRGKNLLDKLNASWKIDRKLKIKNKFRYLRMKMKITLRKTSPNSIRRMNLRSRG
jgi:hypothetical protein